LAVHDNIPEIDWEKGEVRTVWKSSKKKEAREGERKIVRWVIDEKEDWEREEEMEADHRKIEEMVPRWFHR